MKEFEVKFIKNGKELDCFVIDADNMEEAKATAFRLAYMDAVWFLGGDFKIKVSEEF